jgi:hypothetical protein
MNRDSLVVAIEEMYRNHPIPKFPNFKLVSWNDKDTLASADVFLQHNIAGQKRKKLEKYYQYILDSGKPFIVAEAPVFRRNMKQSGCPGAYHRFSWTSYFQNEGNYCNKDSPPDRWNRIQAEQKITIKDWRTTGDYVLLILQRPGDSSLKNLLEKHGSYENFLTFTLNEIKKYTNRPIRVRMHPLRQDRQLEALKNFDVDISINTLGSRQGHGVTEGGDGLYKDFKDAYAVVGFNSNALTESICEGIPTFSMCSSSMAWDCSNKDLSQIESPELFDRQQWLYNLGYCQWREDEIAQGTPWFHLLKRYN